MTIMPVTGIAMGYYGGNGLPFFFTTVPGIVKTDDNKATAGAIAKQVRVQTGWFWGMSHFCHQHLTILFWEFDAGI
jgi:cytochrome b561